jgi:nucleotide-binding universal stress UspA family protein
MVNHILVGVDGSAGSRKAARFAKDLASQAGAQLTLLFVIEPPRVIAVGPMDSFLEFPRSSPEEIEAAHKLLDEVAGGSVSGKVDKVVETGTAAETICAQAEKLKVDLVVVGARGVGPLGRFLVGSVSDRVVHHAGRSVMVVR